MRMFRIGGGLRFADKHMRQLESYSHFRRMSWMRASLFERK